MHLGSAVFGWEKSIMVFKKDPHIAYIPMYTT